MFIKLSKDNLRHGGRCVAHQNLPSQCCIRNFFPMNNSSSSSVRAEPEHLFHAGGERCSLIYPLGRARATLPSPKFTVRESDSSGHREPLKTTESYNSLVEVPLCPYRNKMSTFNNLPGADSSHITLIFLRDETRWAEAASERLK